MPRILSRNVLLLSLALTGLAAQSSAQEWAKAALAKSPRHGEYVTIKEPSGRRLQAWVVYPEVKGKAPVVVMVHEIFGLSDWAREMADEVAAAGYIVVEPDLLSGFGSPLTVPPPRIPTAGMPMDHLPAQDAGVAMMPMMPGGTSAFPDQSAVVKAVSALDPALVITDLNAAGDYGLKQPSAARRLFVAGFCWGGGKSFDFATSRKDLTAAFVFYGPPPPAEAMTTIAAPVYGFYAGDDARISATIPQTVLDMKAAGKRYEPVTYDGAGHGFLRPGEAPDASPGNAAARAAAFRRFTDLLGSVK